MNGATRTPADRIRHALSFEAIGLVLVTPLGAWAFSEPLENVGVVAVVTATIATIWNYTYNWLFDWVLVRRKGHADKSILIRVVHASLFEAGLIVLLVPFIAWYLGHTLFQALAMDVSYSLFYVAYAFVFNSGYDLVFPLPDVGRGG